MTKVYITLAALVAMPVSAQTTSCRYTVAGAPQFGVTCDTQQQQVQRPYRSSLPTLNAAQPQPQVNYVEQDLRARELALRERELRLREAEAGMPRGY